jgi:hypothetical protein
MSPNAVFEYAGDRDALEDDECKVISVQEEVIAKKLDRYDLVQFTMIMNARNILSIFLG